MTYTESALREILQVAQSEGVPRALALAHDYWLSFHDRDLWAFGMGIVAGLLLAYAVHLVRDWMRERATK